MASKHATVDDLEIEPVFFFRASSSGHPWHAACTAVCVTDSAASPPKGA